MKNLVLKKMKVMIALCFIFLASCETENDVAPTTDNVSDEALTTAPKVLATIKLSTGATATFLAEGDEVIYDESGPLSSYREGFSALKNKTILERFLMLTDDEVAVPKRLIAVEENESLLRKATKREVVEQHETEIRSQLTPMEARLSSDPKPNCGSPSIDVFDWEQVYFSVSFDCFLTPAEAYSNWTNHHSGKCRAYGYNCRNYSETETVVTKFYYKNIFGNYKKSKEWHTQPGTYRFKDAIGGAHYYRKATTNNNGAVYDVELAFKSYIW